MLDSRTSRILQLALALAAALGLLFQHHILDVLSFAAIMLYLCAVGSAALLALDALVAWFRRKPASHLWSALLLAICLGPAFPLVEIPFCWASAAHKLWRSQSQYAELVRRAEAGDEVDGFYMTEDGPPRLYSFVWGGIADNWYGIVHDGSQTFDAARRDVLGGDLVIELHLWGPWYYVQFT